MSPGDSPKNWGVPQFWVCGPLSKTLTLFMTSPQANLWPKSEIFPTRFMTYEWPNQKFYFLFMTRYPVSYQNSGKMAKIDTLIWLKRLKNPTVWGSTCLYSPYKGVALPDNVRLTSIMGVSRWYTPIILRVKKSINLSWTAWYIQCN